MPTTRSGSPAKNSSNASALMIPTLPAGMSAPWHVPLLTSELDAMLLSQLIPNAHDLLALEPEELAGALLEVLNSYSEMQSGNLNRYNFSISPDAVQGYPPGQHGQIRQAVMEAWAWLEREGLIVPRVGQQGEWVAVSRRGKQLAGRGGLDAYRK